MHLLLGYQIASLAGARILNDETLFTAMLPSYVHEHKNMIITVRSEKSCLKLLICCQEGWVNRGECHRVHIGGEVAVRLAEPGKRFCRIDASLNGRHSDGFLIAAIMSSVEYVHRHWFEDEGMPRSAPRRISVRVGFCSMIVGLPEIIKFLSDRFILLADVFRR